MTSPDDDNDDRSSLAIPAGVQSVETAARVLAAFLAAPGSLPLTAVAAAAGMSGGKAHRYLVSLCRAGLLVQDSETQRYDLGTLALRLGLAALSRLDVARLAAPVLADLRDALNETVVLAVWGENGPTVIRWEGSSRPVTVNVHLGDTLPLLTSSTGRCFLTWMPEHRTRPFVDLEQQRTGAPDDAALAVLRARFRVDGVTTAEGSLLPGVSAVSAPVFDHAGAMAAAVTALGHAGAFSPTADGKPAQAVRAAADDITRRMGGRPPRA